MNVPVKSMRDTSKLLSAQVLISIFSVAYFFIITLLLSKVELAAIPVFAVITGLCSIVVGFGLPATCIQKAPGFIAEGNKREASALIKASIVIPVLFSLALAFAVFILSDQISEVFFKTAEYANLIKIMSIGVVTFRLNESLVLILPATDRFGRLSIIRILNGVVTPLIALSLYIFFDIGGYITGLILGQVLSSALALYSIRDFIFYKSELGFHTLKKLVSYSSPYYTEGFMRFGSMHADQFIVGVFLAPEILATYYVAKTFLNYLVQYVGALLEPVVPKIAQIKTQGFDTVEKGFAMTSRYLSFALIPVSFLIASLSYPLLQIFGSGKYISGVPVLAILALSGIVYGLYSIYGINVYILGKPILRLEQESVNGILNVVFVLALIVPLGIIGCALAKFFSLFFAMLFSMYLLKKLISMVFDIFALKQAFFASTAMAGIIVLGQVVYYNLFAVPIYVLIGGVAYLTLTCRNLENGDIDLFRDFLPERFLFVLNVVYLFGGEKLRQNMKEAR
jgi:O-antigen/teichoic acid export membrane protein